MNTSTSTRDICANCVLDLSVPEIVFDEHGVCNFCHAAQQALAEVKADRSKKNVLDDILKDATGEYDCLIGLSGGVDSSYTLLLAHQMGLNVLAFSLDTGYNKPEADENIMRLVEGLKVPFFRYTIDTDLFKELQSAFFKAGVKNVEIPTDHVLMAASYAVAAEYGIRTILSGGNVATESIMPPSWGYNARDLVHIKAIFKRFRGRRLTGLPLCGFFKWNWYRWVKRLKTVYLLDYIDYNRSDAEKILIDRFGYQSTGEKHEENYFTWWFQNFYLFEKFGIDKRKAHYSSMINSGQMTREEALEHLLSSPVYPELGIETLAMSFKRHEHSDYPQDKRYDRMAKLIRWLS